MKKLLSVFSVLCMMGLAFPMSGNAAIYYVNAAATGANNGSSWTDAYTDLQSAMNLPPVSGDEIWVAKGVYKPAAAGSTGVSFNLKPGVKYYGHFAGTEGAVSERNLADPATQTVLSGDIDNNDTADAYGVVTDYNNVTGTNTAHVVQGYANSASTSIGPDTVLDGFTITAGSAGAGWGSGLTGLALSGYTCKPTLKNLIISGNKDGLALRFASTGGGNCDFILTNSTLSGNGGNAGAMDIGGCKATITDVTVSNNTSSGDTVGVRGNSIWTRVNFINNTSHVGGAIYTSASGTGYNSPTFIDCNFINNTSTGSGGAVYNEALNTSNSSPTFTNCKFIGNTASSNGGAIQNSANGGTVAATASPTFTNVIFSGNSGGSGGALHNAVSGGGIASPILNNVVFSGNKTTNGGAIVNIVSGTSGGNNNPIMTNVTFSGNRATTNGGAIINTSVTGGICAPTLKNVIMFGNSATTGTQIYNNNATPTISNSLIQGGITGSGVYNTGTSSITDGGGNIDADPLFVNPIPASSAPTTAGDYHLQLCSPAINKGDNSAVSAPTDPDGNPRIFDSIVDIGAYEYQTSVYKNVSIPAIASVGTAGVAASATATGVGIGERGFYWWNANDSSGYLPAGAGAGDFSLTLTGLKPDNTYNVRAYINVCGQIISSDALTFTTRTSQIPVVHTSSSFTLSGSDLTASGEITDVGGSPILIYGFVYANHPVPTVWDKALAFAWDTSLPLSVGKAFSGTISNLAPGTYYLRAYAHNDTGTAYGEEITFTIYTAGFTVSPAAGLTTSESGGSATFTVKPNTQPTADVTLNLSSTNTAEGIISPLSLTFTPQNWNTPQTVTVIGVDDYIADGNQSYKISFSPAVSTDSAYTGLKPDDIPVINTDNDIPGFTVSPTGGLTTSESGAPAAFSVRLNTQPSADVTVNLSSSDASEGTVSATSLIFTSLNWNSFQQVTVTGVDDTLIDGDQSYKVILSPAISTDSAYNGLKPDDASVINLDNDQPPPPVNHAPAANADNYSVNQDASLNIAAPGVLENDTDADKDALTAVKVSDPANGILTFGSNGSFGYTPKSGFYGTDSFTYKAYDGKADSAAVAVKITVNYVPPYIPPYIPPSIPPQPPQDNCPNDPDKTDPGKCGCGIPDTDSDGDGVADCLDKCPLDPKKTESGKCGCGKPETENCVEDKCPNDPNKTEPGKCGCGVSDTDSDGDGVADCLDKCPSDPKKTEPGKCGCGIDDKDSDGDSVPDCKDLCLNDPKKTEPGKCGCGIDDKDSDGDGVADCKDLCLNDPKKTDPGKCGCGVPDTDSKGDGIADCLRGDPPKTPVSLSPEYQSVIPADRVTLTAGQFSASGNQPHSETHWLIRRADTPDRDAFFTDSVINSGDLTSYNFADAFSGMKYFWKVGYKDSGNIQASWSSVSSFIVGTPEQSVIIEIPPGGTVPQYQMFSIPYWTKSEELETVRRSIIGNYDIRKFRIGAYNAQTGRYTEYGEGLKMMPGKAYWILSRNGLKISFDGVPVSLNHTIGVVLDSGWNMISAPNYADYDWNKVELVVYDDNGNAVYGPAPVSASDSQKYIETLWQWQNGDYLPADTLEKTKGCWLKAKQSGVVLRFPESARGKSATRSEKRSSSAEKPPLPMGNTAFSISTDSANAAGGCFIDSVLQRR